MKLERMLLEVETQLYTLYADVAEATMYDDLEEYQTARLAILNASQKVVNARLVTPEDKEVQK
jgi:hypothetical protein